MPCSVERCTVIVNNTNDDGPGSFLQAWKAFVAECCDGEKWVQFAIK